MAPPPRVLVAMSGGVDSSVAAALLVEQGLSVFGVTLHLWDAGEDEKIGRCCAPEDRDDARRVAEHLGIPHYTLDEREAFRAHVVDPFIDESLAGRTPSPCVHCNRTVKLERLVGLADELGATHVATGHYARIERRGDAHRLLRGRDRDKDQSYFLYALPERTLGKLLFPLGGLVDKTAARAEGRRLGLPNADKPDSQNLCFVPDGDVLGFVSRERGAPDTGRIVDREGRILGYHRGLPSLTVGQRRGLDLGGGPKRYVLRIVPDTGDVVVGDEHELYGARATVTDVSWAGAAPEKPFEAAVRVRYRHEPAPATIRPTAEGFVAEFHEGVRAITPGQAGVVYDGDEVLAGGLIA